MSSGQKAATDDEDDWYDLKQEAGVQDTNWQVYSDECRYAKEGYKSKGFTGARLKLFVKHAVEDQKVRERHAKEFHALEEVIKLGVV